jgi:hypothetical protein
MMPARALSRAVVRFSRPMNRSGATVAGTIRWAGQRALLAPRRDNRCSVLGFQLCQRLASKKAHRGYLRRF